MKSAKKSRIARLILTISVAITGFAFQANPSVAQQPPEKQQVVVLRDVTKESGCMYGDIDKLPMPCPINTVRFTRIVSEADAISRGEVFVRIDAKDTNGVNNATDQLFQELSRRQSSTSTSNNQSILTGGEKVLLKPAAQGCGGNTTRLFLLQGFGTPQTQVKFTTTYYKSYGGGGCNVRTPVNMSAELQWGPNVNLTGVSYYSAPSWGGGWSGTYCNPLNTGMSFPTPMYQTYPSAYVNVRLRRGGCNSWNPSLDGSWNLP